MSSLSLSLPRFYKKKFPDVGDIIIVKITGISDNKGAYAESLEFPDVRVYVLPTEIARRNVNLKTFFSPDKYYPTRVLFVDQIKKLTDVSYTKVTEPERKESLERFTTFQKIYKLGIDTCIHYNTFTTLTEPSQQIPSFDICEIVFNDTIWPIYNNIINNSDNTKTINSFFTGILENPSTLFSTSPTIATDFIDKFVTHLKQRIKISDIELICEVTLIVLERDAIARIQNIFQTDIDPSIKIDYVSSPRYNIIAINNDKLVAEQQILNTIKVIETNCKKYSGKLIKVSNISVLKERTYTLSGN